MLKEETTFPTHSSETRNNERQLYSAGQQVKYSEGQTQKQTCGSSQSIAMLRTTKDHMIERHWNKSLWRHLKTVVMVQGRDNFILRLTCRLLESCRKTRGVKDPCSTWRIRLLYWSFFSFSFFLWVDGRLWYPTSFITPRLYLWCWKIVCCDLWEEFSFGITMRWSEQLEKVN